MPYADKKKQSAHNFARMERRRQEWLQANGPCASCGSTEKLEVDHIDETTKVTHRVWSWSDARRNEELAKCQVLCEKCHQEKTTALKLKPLVHGTFAGYSAKGCRCEACCLANTLKVREYRKARRG